LDDRWYFNFENYLFNKIYPTPELKQEAKEKFMERLYNVDRYGDPAYTHDPDQSIAPAQVITREEANKVFEIAEEATKREDTIIALSRCNCALAYRGKIEYRCIVFGVPITWSSEIGYQRYPREGLTEFKGAEWSELKSKVYAGRRVPLKPEEAKELFQDWTKRGFQTTLVTRAIFPLIDGLCFCEAPYCQRIRRRKLAGLQNDHQHLRKGHYVARINPEKCNACGACMIRCMYGAVIVRRWSDIAHIEPADCFGCGICRAGCRYEAIDMVQREEIPAAREQW